METEIMVLHRRPTCGVIVYDFEIEQRSDTEGFCLHTMRPSANAMSSVYNCTQAFDAFEMGHDRLCRVLEQATYAADAGHDILN